MKNISVIILILFATITYSSAQSNSSATQYTIDDLNKEIADYKNVFYSDSKEFYDQDGYAKLVSKKEKLKRILTRITTIDHSRVVECPVCKGGDTPTKCFKCGGSRYEKRSKYTFCKNCNGSGFNNDLCKMCLGAKRILTDFLK